MTDKKWFFKFILYACGVLLIMGLIIYIWDPYNYYRINNNKLKYVASAYIDAGIIKNADYDTAIIGSSVSQNFDVQLFRDVLGINPVKVTTGGITLEQRDLFYSKIASIDKADTFYVEIAISSFNAEDDKLDDTPVYLYDDNIWNDYKYLYGYETWFRGMPISIIYRLCDILGIEISTSHNLKSVDNVGDWYYRKPVGEEIFKKNYLSGNASISKQDTDNMRERMMDNVDKKLTNIISEDNHYIFYFPPYSAAYWSDAESAGYADIWCDVKEYIENKLLEYNNVEVYDFQYTDEICNLEHYRDVTHYGKELNDWMTMCFSTEEYKVTRENIKENIICLKSMLQKFRKENSEWIK